MADEPSSTKYVGTSLSAMLGVLFIALKLLHVIDWSWWFVLMPLYIPWAILLGVLVIFFGISLAVALLQAVITKTK